MTENNTIVDFTKLIDNEMIKNINKKIAKSNYKLESPKSKISHEEKIDILNNISRELDKKYSGSPSKSKSEEDEIHYNSHSKKLNYSSSHESSSHSKSYDDTRSKSSNNSHSNSSNKSSSDNSHSNSSNKSSSDNSHSNNSRKSSSNNSHSNSSNKSSSNNTGPIDSSKYSFEDYHKTEPEKSNNFDKTHKKFKNLNLELFNFYGILLPSDIDIVEFMRRLVGFLYKRKNIDAAKEYIEIIRANKLQKKYEINRNKSKFYEDMFWISMFNDLDIVEDMWHLPFRIDIQMGNTIDGENVMAIIFGQLNITYGCENVDPYEMIEKEEEIVEKIEKYDDKLLDFLCLITNSYYGWHLSYNIIQ